MRHCLASRPCRVSKRAASPFLFPGRGAMPIPHVVSIFVICWFCLVQPIAAQTVPDLVETLQDEGPEARRQAIDDLAKIGPKAKPAIPRLAKLLEDDHNGT